MNKPSDYDSVQPAQPGEAETLEPGGYICKILNAETQMSKAGNEMLILSFDIAEGDKKGFYRKKYDANENADKKWQGIYRQLTQGSSTKFFKGLITSIELSNNGYKFDFNEKSLVGKYFGGIFGREEYFSIYKGEYIFHTKLVSVRAADIIRKGEFKIPPDKLADKTGGAARSSTSAGNPTTFFSPIVEDIDDEDLPF